MAEKPEDICRTEIDRLLAAGGWWVQAMSQANIRVSPGGALCDRQTRELRLEHFDEQFAYDPNQSSPTYDCEWAGIYAKAVDDRLACARK